MASKKMVRVVIAPDGEVSIEAIGFQGNACEQATHALEEALGTVEKRIHKPEYRQRAVQSREQSR